MKAALLVALTLAVPTLANAQTAGPPAPPPGCTAPESRQFDFWIGAWDVYVNGKPDRKVAQSLIENLYLGCAIRENWQIGRPSAGGSLSSYVPAEKGWRQTWVDSSGARVEFTGGWTGGAMVLAGVWPQPGHPTQLTRMTYSRQPDGAVRQLGESSDDQGKTWQPSFDFIYRKAAS
jgi:hypothetical protein